MSDMEGHPGPNAEFQCLERRKLITEILEAIRQYENKGRTSRLLLAPAWACLWLADIPKLREIMVGIKRSPFACCTELNGYFHEAKFLSLWTGTSHSGATTPASKPTTPTRKTHFSSSDSNAPGLMPITSPTKRKRLSDSSLDDTAPGTPTQQKRPKRSSMASDLGPKRDQVCVVTRASEPTNSSHVAAFSFTKSATDTLNVFWQTLEMFWGDEKVRAWRDFVDSGESETPKNYISLCPNAHQYWDLQLFALEPVGVSDDQKTLSLRFHWLLPDRLESLQLTSAALPQQPATNFLVEGPTFVNKGQQGGRRALGARVPNVRLYDVDTDKPISSGEAITITTNDPDQLPLPNIEILRLQWILHRVVALAAAAGYQEDSNDDKDYDTGVFDPLIVSDSEDTCTLFGESDTSKVQTGPPTPLIQSPFLH